MRFLPALLLPLLAGWVNAAPAQRVEDPGPQLVGWRDVAFVDTNFGLGPVSGRVYYPALAAGEGAAADPAAGPYPLVGFQHGWFGSPENYDALCSHLASWGFVVASIGGYSGLFATMAAEAGGTQALLHWVDGESDNPSSWLNGMAADGDWAASGHSMGGGALFYLIGIEPRVRTVVALQPYAGSALGGSAQGFANLESYTGNVAILTGELDDLVDEGERYFAGAPNARRNLYHMVLGMGHGGPTDEPPNNEPLPAAEQHRLHRRIVAGVLRAEMRGEENLYSQVLGDPMAVEPVQFQSDCGYPVFWSVLGAFSAGSLDTGFAGRTGDFLTSGWSYVPANIQTAAGVLGINPLFAFEHMTAVLPGNGVCDASMPLMFAWSGRTVYFQGLRLAPGPRVLTATHAVAMP